jgi:hypothetical protein
VNLANSVSPIWTGIWTPASYGAASVSFALANGTANPNTQANAIIVRDSSNTGGHSTGTVYVGRGADNFGGGVNISVIPTPSSLALLGLGGLVASRRRR